MAATSPQLQIAELDRIISNLYDNQNNWWADYDGLLSRFAGVVTTPVRDVYLPFLMPSVAAREVMEGQEPEFTGATLEKVQVSLRGWGDGAFINRVDMESPIEQQRLMRQATQLPDIVGYSVEQIAYDILINGDTGGRIQYDGELLFSETHTPNTLNPSGTWSNLFNGLPPSAESLQEIIANFKRLPIGPQGQPSPLAGAKFTVLAPWEQELSWGEVLFNTQKAEQNIVTENRMKGRADLFLDARFTNPNDYYVVMQLPGLTPFVHIQHTTENRSLRSDIKPDGPAAKRGVYEWWVRSYENVIEGQFFLWTKVTNGS